MKLKFVLALIAGLSAPASAQYCPGCVQNTPAPLTAQFNISSATVRGQFTAGTLNVGSITATSLSLSSPLSGSGSGLTNLNGSQILSGTIPSGRLVGLYGGITGVGTVTSGTWQGSILGSIYGGTGANLSAAAWGSLPFFNAAGVMGALPPSTAQYILQTNGSGQNPSWTGTPHVLGTFITGIPMTNLVPGNLPMSIAINDASISTVSAAKVVGDIPGNSNNINGTLPLTKLAHGTLVTDIAASSITVTGVHPGYWGGPNQLVQMNIGTDGRIYGVTQSSFTINVGSITAGALPPGVTIGANQITAGSLGSGVIASSIAASGVSAGSYGSASNTLVETVQGDGRLTSVSATPISIAPSQIQSGNLPSGVNVPAMSIQSGALGSGVIASSLTATGVTAGTYGSSTKTTQFTVDGSGRISSASEFVLPAVSTNIAYINQPNYWAVPQISSAQWTINNIVIANQFQGAFSGDGNQITNINRTALPVAVAFKDIDNNWSHAQTSQSSWTISATSSYSLTTSSGVHVLAGSVSAPTYFGDGSHLTGIGSSGVCQAGTGLNSVLCQGSGNVASATNTVVSGGSSNTASSQFASVINGYLNVVNAPYSFVGDGNNNSITDTGYYLTGHSVIVSGSSNTINGTDSFIGSGHKNSIVSQFGEGIIVGGDNNSITGDYASSIMGGDGNTIQSIESFIGGGSSNFISTSTGLGDDSSILGGINNVIHAQDSVITGGTNHTNDGNNSFLGAGSGNEIDALGYDGAIVAGTGNLIDTGNKGFIGSGDNNTVSGTYSSVVGGFFNATTGQYSFIGGGLDNQANGESSTVPGGESSYATGDRSFAAGFYARAISNGSFVWADQSPFPTGTTYTDNGANTFNVRATGGAFFTNNVTAAAFFGDGSGLTGISTGTLPSDIAYNDKDNNWSHAQTSQSSWTFTSGLGVGAIGLSGSLAVFKATTTTPSSFGNILVLDNSNNEDFRIRSDGLITIHNPSSPDNSKSLDVNGDVRMRNNLNVNQTLNVDSDFFQNTGGTTQLAHASAASMSVSGGFTAQSDSDLRGKVWNNGGATNTIFFGTVHTGSPPYTFDANYSIETTTGIHVNGGQVLISTSATSIPFMIGPSLMKVDNAGNVTATSFSGNGSALTNIPYHGFLSGNNGTLGVSTFTFANAPVSVTISSVTVVITVSGSGGSTGTTWSCCYAGSCVDVTSTAGASPGTRFTGTGALTVPIGGEIDLELKSTDETVTPTANAVCGY